MPAVLCKFMVRKETYWVEGGKERRGEGSGQSKVGNNERDKRIDHEPRDLERHDVAHQQTV